VDVGPLPGPIVRVRSLDDGPMPDVVASALSPKATGDELHLVDGRARVDTAAFAYVRIDTVAGDAVRPRSGSAGRG
jgi:hypothetical protein